MRLQSIKYQNFKGVKDFTLTPDGNDIAVIGRNETGKTTLMDGPQWLFTDKDSEGKANFSIKPLNPDGSEQNNLESSIESIFLLPDGTQTSLLKIYREKWTQRRGAPRGQKEFTGHETKYKVDGVPKSKKLFNEKVAELIGSENIYLLLTDPFAFSRLHWKEQRQIVLDVCGDIPDSQIIEATPGLEKLAELLANVTADDHRAIVGARRAEINERIKEIPARIDELANSLPAPVDVGKLKHDLGNIQQEMLAHDADKKIMLTDEGAAARETKIAGLKSKLLLAIQDAKKAVNDEAEKLETEARKKKSAYDDLLTEHEKREAEAARVSGEIEKNTELLYSLRNEYNAKDAEKYEPPQAETVCPTCGQDIPAEQIAEAVAKAEADFNTGKAKELEAINVRGRGVKAEVEKLTAELSALKTEIEKTGTTIPTLHDEIEELNKQIYEIRTRPQPDEIGQLEAEITELKEQAQSGAPVDTSEVDAKIEDCKGREAEIQKQIAAQESAKKSRGRIEQLENEERELSTEYEKLGQELDLLDRFMVAKVAAFESKVAKKFAFVRFKMFNVQVNGGIDPTCQIMYNGVPWGSMNNAARINCGLDIINALGAHYGFRPPIFIDNAESVCDIIKTEAQQIRLYVDETADELMTMEVQHANK